MTLTPAQAAEIEKLKAKGPRERKVRDVAPVTEVTEDNLLNFLSSILGDHLFIIPKPGPINPNSVNAENFGHSWSETVITASGEQALKCSNCGWVWKCSQKKPTFECGSRPKVNKLTCKYCGDENVIWVKTQRGKHLLFNVDNGQTSAKPHFKSCPAINGTDNE